MNSLHANSLCCQEKVIRFGSRRRQCSRCKHTWRIRQKKRGRKSIRATPDLVQRYVSGRLSFTSRLSYKQFNYRIKKSRDVVLRKESLPSIPPNMPCIAIVDAMINKIDGSYVTTYFVLIRMAGETEAIIASASTRIGYEKGMTWFSILVDEFPLDLKQQVQAIICDGARIFTTVARHNNWKLQRCHFHLLSAFYNRLSGARSRKRFKRTGHRILALVRTVLESSNEREVNAAINRLSRYRLSPHVPNFVRIRLIPGFLRNWRYYRTYLVYPTLNLPRTSNSCESLIKITRTFLAKARGFRTYEALDKWIQALVLKRKTIRCKGTKNQPNSFL